MADEEVCEAVMGADTAVVMEIPMVCTEDMAVMVIHMDTELHTADMEDMAEVPQPAERSEAEDVEEGVEGAGRTKFISLIPDSNLPSSNLPQVCAVLSNSCSMLINTCTKNNKLKTNLFFFYSDFFSECLDNCFLSKHIKPLKRLFAS